MTRKEYRERLFETYELVSVLSRKNGGEVLRLRHKTMGRDLILRLYPAPVEAYEKLCAVTAENLPEIYDVTALADGQAVLEEFIDGITVAAVMQSGRYRVGGVKRVMKAVCRALTVLNELGIVHRDVKPENVMVTPKGRVVLIDLNAARIVSGAAADTVIMGTVGYASPEQLGIRESDHRTDVYAAGILLNVMLTGKHPSEELAGGRLGRVVKKCTAIHPGDRYQSAEALSEALSVF